MARAVEGRGRPRKLFERDITKDRKISKFHLDRCAEEQPDIFGYWSDLKPKAKKKVDNIQLELDILAGTKYIHYKDVLDGGKDSKGNAKTPTDTAVNNAITIDEDVIALKRSLILEQEFLGLVESAIKTMDQRRSSLKVLESLNHDNYYESQGQAADDYNAREYKKSKIAEGKSKISEGLNKIDIPEDDELPAEDPEETDEEVETEDPEETVETEDETVDEEMTELESDTPVGDDEEVESEETEEVVETEDEPESEDPEPEEETASPEESDDENPCPHGKVFGNYGHYDECDDCDMEGPCFRESKKQ